MKNEYDVIVLGAGPVGLYTTFLLSYFKLNCLCLEIDDQIGGRPLKMYGHKPIYDFITYKDITGSELIKKLVEQVNFFKQYNKIQTNTKIINYKKEDSKIILFDDQKNEYICKKLILACGVGAFQPVKINCDPAFHHKISYFLDDHNFYKNKKICVLGGGDSAIDLAIHLKKLGIDDLCLIHRRNEFNSMHHTYESINQYGIDLKLNYTLTNIDHNVLKITHNDTNDIEYINYDHIICQYGLSLVNSEYHNWSEIEFNNKKIMVNRYMQSSDEDVYAVGTCCYYESRTDLIMTGVSEATIAVNHICSLLKDKKTGW